MPNRIIKESIRTSYEINDLSADAEVSFYRLLTYADDYGRFPSDIRILQAQLFPLKASVRSKDFDTWVSELVEADLIRLYIGDDKKPYGFFPTWEDHQNIRNQRSKFPEPQGDLFDSLTYQLNEIERRRNQLKSTDINCTRESNPIQSESNPNPNSDGSSESETCYEFDEFWEDYDKKKERKKCERKWKRISEKNRSVIKRFIPVYKQHQPDSDYRKNPSTFLNNEIWMDDWESYPPQSIKTKSNGGSNGVNRKSKGDKHVDFLTS